MTDLSDVSVKENIVEIDNALSALSELRPVTFDFVSSYYDSIPEEARQFVIDQKKNSIGFIAQEVQQVLPDLVNEIPGSNLLGINTIDLIPFLVKAVQEQENKITALENQVATLSGDIKKSSELETLMNSDLKATQAYLLQNIPNPFDENTIITFSIPRIENYAMLNVYDLQGSQVISHKISQIGTGEFTIPAYELDPGLYIYNLIVDGTEIDSKRMVLME